jgi:peptidoglycan hydrolase CwlO-like protein
MNWLKNLLTSKKIQQLEKKIEELETELDKRQEAINKTNAYWKKKVHELTRKQSS